MRAWIGLGGNFDESERMMESALAMLDETRGVRVIRRSGLYRSPPWGVANQADFVNAVAEIETSLTPDELLSELLSTENRLGRRREGQRWGPRGIDLDLLTFGDRILESENLQLPHPRMHLRAFVLKPILELEPGFRIPGLGTAQRALEQLDPQEAEAVRPIDPNEQESSP